jgi:hypothetical protein
VRPGPNLHSTTVCRHREPPAAEAGGLLSGGRRYGRMGPNPGSDGLAKRQSTADDDFIRSLARHADKALNANALLSPRVSTINRMRVARDRRTASGQALLADFLTAFFFAFSLTGLSCSSMSSFDFCSSSTAFFNSFFSFLFSFFRSFISLMVQLLGWRTGGQSNTGMSSLRERLHDRPCARPRPYVDLLL